MYFSIPFSFISMPIISKSTLLCLFFVVTLPSVLNKVKDMMWLLLAFLSAALLGFYDGRYLNIVMVAEAQIYHSVSLALVYYSDIYFSVGS